MSEFDDIVLNFFKNYQDRGMKKWTGYYLSDHTQKIEKDSQLRNHRVIPRKQQDQKEISEILLTAFGNHQRVNIQLNKVDQNGVNLEEISGFIAGYQEEIIYLDEQQIELNEILNVEIE